MPEERSDSFGPIDIGMWNSPGWKYIAERAMDDFIESVRETETILTFGPFYVSGVGLRLPEHYKH